MALLQPLRIQFVHSIEHALRSVLNNKTLLSSDVAQRRDNVICCAVGGLAIRLGESFFDSPLDVSAAQRTAFDDSDLVGLFSAHTDLLHDVVELLPAAYQSSNVVAASRGVLNHVAADAAGAPDYDDVAGSGAARLAPRNRSQQLLASSPHLAGEHCFAAQSEL